MISISLDKFNLNSFWEKTPNTLKYILVFSILLATLYFVVSKRLDDLHLKEIETMKIGINATYELIDKFEKFRRDQDAYNKEVLVYLKNLHALVIQLNETTNRKFDLILKSGSIKNTNEILEKIELLNESFDRVSKIYGESLTTTPSLDDKSIKPSQPF